MKAFSSLVLALLLLGSPYISLAVYTTPGTLATDSTEWDFDRTNKEFRIHFGKETQGEVLYQDEDLLNIYMVRHDRLFGGAVHWDDKTRKTFDDYRIWDMFANIAGKTMIKKNVGAYATYRGPEVPVYAFVTRVVGANEPSWVLAVNANAANFNSNTWQRDMAITLLHEYGHIVTMNKTQVNNKVRSAINCKNTLFIDYRIAGCTTKKSYVNAFVKEFWTQRKLDAALESVNERTDSFFRANRSSFVTKYAASNPLEDIAESYADFILRRKPTGTTEKELKVLFFYNYPELVKERTRIRDAIVGYLHL